MYRGKTDGGAPFLQVGYYSRLDDVPVKSYDVPGKGDFSFIWILFAVRRCAGGEIFSVPGKKALVPGKMYFANLGKGI